MSIAMDYPRISTAVRAQEQRFGVAHGEKISNIDQDVRALQQIAVKTRIARGETIFNEGDEARYAYKVVSGAVRLCKHMADGRRQIADFLIPGDFFGFLQFGHYSFTAEAVGDVVLMCYPQRQLEQISSSTPALRKRILVLLSQRLLGMQDHLVMLGRQTAKERVASFLLQLAERTGVEDGEILELPMSRQDIADYLGLTIETVCRTLTEFKRMKLIGIPDLHQAALKDLEALRAIAEGDEGI
jgi:CRP-like cAMP-binding protein